MNVFLSFPSPVRSSTSHGPTSAHALLVVQAIAYWGKALSVVPVAAPLHYPAFCNSLWSDAAKTCAGVAVTNMCGAVKVPDDLVMGQRYCTESPTKGCTTSTPSGAGSADTDLFLLVTVKDTNCGGSTQVRRGGRTMNEW